MKRKSDHLQRSNPLSEQERQKKCQINAVLAQLAARQHIGSCISSLVPGKRLDDVIRIIADEAKKGGFETGPWSGYGMGMDFGDGISLYEDNHLELKAGMVFTIHPQM